WITLGLVDKDFRSTDLGQCLVQNPQISLMLSPIKNFILHSKLTVFNTKTLKGELKHIIIYFNPQSQESYLRFVLRSKEAHSRMIKHLAGLTEQIPHLKVVSLNIQPSPHPILEGEEEIILTQQTHLNHI